MRYYRLYTLIILIFISSCGVKKVSYRDKSPKKIKSPGQFKFHYSPGIPVIMNRKYREKDQAFVVFGKKFKEGKEKNIVGIDIPWNVPLNYDLKINMDHMLTINQTLKLIAQKLKIF